MNKKFKYNQPLDKDDFLQLVSDGYNLFYFGDGVCKINVFSHFYTLKTKLGEVRINKNTDDLYSVFDLWQCGAII